MINRFSTTVFAQIGKEIIQIDEGYTYKDCDDDVYIDTLIDTYKFNDLVDFFTKHNNWVYDLYLTKMIFNGNPVIRGHLTSWIKVTKKNFKHVKIYLECRKNLNVPIKQLWNECSVEEYIAYIKDRKLQMTQQ